MQVSTRFPLHGIIGVVTKSQEELDQATAKGLQCVEIRADQLLDAGLSLNQVIATVTRAKAANLATLFTLRHPSHGGKFNGSEQDRVGINRQAINAGADVIDLEWNTEASKQMLSESAPLILSYHDFDGMPAHAELDSLTRKMSSDGPRAIKIVPTASSVTESARMLHWLEASTDERIARIGFCMGSAGVCSRILTTAFGAPVTYASLGKANAPGQVAIDDLLDNYRVMNLNQQTQTVAVIGDGQQVAQTVQSLNQQYHAARRNSVAVGFQGDTVHEVELLKKTLRIAEIRILED